MVYSLTTFSIVARCLQSGELGVAVSTAIPAVGAINPFARAQVGAIATQAWSNPYLGIDGLHLLNPEDRWGYHQRVTLSRRLGWNPG